MNSLSTRLPIRTLRPATALPVQRQAANVWRALLACATLLLLTGGRANAALSPASVIDGPSSSILDVDGAAMAPDGSGGLLYRKLIDNEPHLFVARLFDGSWETPVEVDADQSFGASQPAIAAGDDGRLLVVWIEPWAVVDQVTQYQLMSAELSPGASSFGPAEQVDPKSVGDGSATFPSLAMAPNGNAYVVYRVVTDSFSTGVSNIVPLRPGDELVEVRVAHYNGPGLPWSTLGSIDQFPQLTTRRPSPNNAPVIGVSNQGSAVVAWQEPDGTGYARIWARRIFGNTLGNVLPVSPTTANGQPVDVDADALAMSVTPLGEAKVAFRLAGGPGSPYGGERMFVNTLPPITATNGNQLTGPQVVAAATTFGPPSISLVGSGGTGAYRLAYTAGAVTDSLTGSDYSGNGTPVALGGAQGEETTPTTSGPNGGGVTVWRTSNQAGLPVVDAREEFAGGGWQLGQLSAPLSGPVDPPVLGGAGLGDTLIAFSQGPPGQTQVMAAVAKAPPAAFQAQAPIGWVKGTSAKIAWEAASEAFGQTTYSILVDGQVRLRDLTGLSARLNPHGLGNGIHQVQVLATDSLGQQTMTPPAELKVDASPPLVNVIRLSGRLVRVRVVDHASGAVARDTLIGFGDGTRTVRGVLSAGHTYARAGVYTIIVHDADRVGIRGVAHIRVQVP
jgi:hypothetical protein